MNYKFLDHIHNYAVWTAARASQRGFTTTANIKAAIDQTGLKQLMINKHITDVATFDKFHRETANTIIKILDSKGLKTTYGRASKIIAIYLKTAVIIRDSGESQLSKIIHPPIDNILLTNLNKNNNSLSLAGIKWTKLNEEEYFILIKKLRNLNLNKFWEIEEYWEPSLEL